MKKEEITIKIAPVTIRMVEVAGKKMTISVFNQIISDRPIRVDETTMTPVCEGEILGWVLADETNSLGGRSALSKKRFLLWEQHGSLRKCAQYSIRYDDHRILGARLYDVKQKILRQPVWVNNNTRADIYRDRIRNGMNDSQLDILYKERDNIVESIGESWFSAVDAANAMIKSLFGDQNQIFIAV